MIEKTLHRRGCTNLFHAGAFPTLATKLVRKHRLLLLCFLLLGFRKFRIKRCRVPRQNGPHSLISSFLVLCGVEAYKASAISTAVYFHSKALAIEL